MSRGSKKLWTVYLLILLLSVNLSNAKEPTRYERIPYGAFEPVSIPSTDPPPTASPQRDAGPVVDTFSRGRPGESSRPDTAAVESQVEWDRVDKHPADGPRGGSGWIRDPEISWYGPGFYGNRTACGQRLTRDLLGVAHKTLPCGTMVSFRHEGNVITIPVVDRGPYVAGRQWDLTGGACTALSHCFTGPIYYRYP